MNRTEFIQMLGLAAVASVVPVHRDGKLPKEKIETKEEGKDYEKLYQIVNNGESIEIAGMKFYIESMEIEADQDAFGRIGRKRINLSLYTAGQ